ncbi:ABC transporter ATP-binding protein [Flavihumibacter profundi]|uniref:ABC transporter ATP-binding protein n=1 Tax=Flavihumibacter profundi TaxID=2716883 RepID=UPI001CC3B63E|nr:ABC transporter ATP-binding protein [Flavihumibacter profundi]MBZ5858029.1 ABC transporter ATP-binding protein [Flavihumibacter profundi]
MSDLVLEVEHLSKLYRKGTIGTGSLRQDINYWWNRNILKKESPFFSGQQDALSKSAQFWALKDINFQVKHGEVWGIVGANGAGKSTLLKILSRIIKPSTGAIRGKGKVSSLLEIGTGFHNELSGKENIFLAGYILGMKKWEIQKRLEEIVDFSGVEEFIDTPIKRYSSGMYVRLAFAVAAHLEPDILIVDEVLAVGDIDFQKKCLGKMKEASNDRGRTILFVSHNMQAVNQLCSKGIWLDRGKMAYIGEAQEAVNAYMSNYQSNIWKQNWPVPEEAPGNDQVRLTYIELIPRFSGASETIDIRTPLQVKFRFFNYLPNEFLVAEMVLFTTSGECVFDVSHAPEKFSVGWVEGEVQIPGKFLNDGSYSIGLAIFNREKETLLYKDDCLQFTVADYSENNDWYVKWWGIVRPDFPFAIRQVND